MTSKEQVLERYPSAEYMAGAIVSHYAVASEAFVYFSEEDEAWESAARLLPAPAEPAPKEGEKVCIGATDDGFEYAKVPSKVESGDGLPPLDVTDEERNLAKETMRTDMEKLLAVNLQCRERQLQASLLREKELKELLREVKLNGLMPPIDGDLLERIKAAG